MTNSISFPFGRDIHTLIICRDDNHRRKVIRALALPAQYETIGSSLMGNRYRSIIVMVGIPESAAEAAGLELMISEYLPTKLHIGGELHVI
jgi:hypothetical protein